jgi:putative membrane protein
VLSHPALNAALNATSAVLLSTGYVMIRRGRVLAHKSCMGLAFLSSMAFLVSYVLYHVKVGSVAFRGEGWIRPVYFTLLASHTVLAASIVPLALITLSRALREDFVRHKRIARWTLPLWLYVSVTGVLIYFLLYHLYATPRAA